MKMYTVQMVREIGEGLYKKGFEAWSSETANYIHRVYAPNDDCFYRVNCWIQFYNERGEN